MGGDWFFFDTRKCCALAARLLRACCACCALLQSRGGEIATALYASDLFDEMTFFSTLAFQSPPSRRFRSLNARVPMEAPRFSCAPRQSMARRCGAHRLTRGRMAPSRQQHQASNASQKMLVHGIQISRFEFKTHPYPNCLWSSCWPEASLPCRQVDLLLWT